MADHLYSYSCTIYTHYLFDKQFLCSEMASCVMSLSNTTESTSYMTMSLLTHTLAYTNLNTQSVYIVILNKISSVRQINVMKCDLTELYYRNWTIWAGNIKRLASNHRVSCLRKLHINHECWLVYIFPSQLVFTGDQEIIPECIVYFL